MRIALVSPYSWTHPGGVNRHVASLASHLRARDHDVRVLAPSDEPVPPDVVTLGRTVAIPFNGARSNVALTPQAVHRLRRTLRQERFDIVHVHEPVACVTGPVTLLTAQAPLVATFHAHSDNPVTHAVAIAAGARRLFDRIDVRLAVSEAAAWTGRRFYGGDYRIIPNGIELQAGAAPRRALSPGRPLEIVFVGQAVERKGLPVLLRAFEALREHVPARLAVVGADAEAVRRLGAAMDGIEHLGRVGEADKLDALRRADVLCAPALGGESFGMVLTEAFAAGTPVIASDIPGYRDVVTDGHDGVLVPAGDASALAVALRDVALEPARLGALSDGAATSARRYAWPDVTDQVLDAYDAAAVAHGAPRAPRTPARRLPPLDPSRTLRARAATGARRLAQAAAVVAVLVAAVLAVHQIGGHAIVRALLSSRPTWVLLALAIMCASMGLRALSWQAALRASPVTAAARLADTARATAIGVLASATMPARLGEACRTVLLARRLGPQRITLPPVLGTLIVQTLLNLVALCALGAYVIAVLPGLALNWTPVVLTAAVPVALAAAVALGPVALRGSRLAFLRRGLARARVGMTVLRRPRLAAAAVVAQLSAWGLQLAACMAVFAAMGLHPASTLGAAATVLFAVNVTAVVPVTPSNVGVFQGTCLAVLAGAYHLTTVDAVGYGVVLQAVEVATAFVLGVPALMREGLTLREVRGRALHSYSVTLPPVAPSGATTT